MKIHVDLKGLKYLSARSVEAGTQDEFIKLALEWAKAANQKISELETAQPTPLRHDQKCPKCDRYGSHLRDCKYGFSMDNNGY